MVLRLVALGDSMSEGVGAPVRGGLAGWVQQLPAFSPEIELVDNLAQAGSRARTVRHLQLKRALSLNPDLVTCVVGINDSLDPRFTQDRFAVEYRALIATLRASVPVGVVAMTIPDFTSALPIPQRSRAMINNRLTQVNEVITDSFQDHRGWLIDGTRYPPLRRRGMLAIDRLHPNVRGHRFIASEVVQLLQDGGVLSLPPRELAPYKIIERVTSSVRHTAWLAHYLPRIVTNARRRGII